MHGAEGHSITRTIPLICVINVNNVPGREIINTACSVGYIRHDQGFSVGKTKLIITQNHIWLVGSWLNDQGFSIGKTRSIKITIIG